MKLLFQIEGVVLIYSGFIQKVFFNEFFYDRSCGWVEEVGFLLYIEDQAFACVVLGKGFHDQSAMQKRCEH